MIGGQFRQVERQARTDHYRIGAAFARLSNVCRVFGNGAHDVDGNQAIAIGNFPGCLDLAIERNQIDGVD